MIWRQETNEINVRAFGAGKRLTQAGEGHENAGEPLAAIEMRAGEASELKIK
jgi:hypothetical protein